MPSFGVATGDGQDGRYAEGILWSFSKFVGKSDRDVVLFVDLRAMRKMREGDTIQLISRGNNDNSARFMADLNVFVKETN